MRLFKHLSYVHFETLITWYSYSVVWCSCMGQMAVVDLIPMFFNFPRLTVNYKLQWVFSSLVYLSHPLQTSAYPKTSTTDIKMREQLSYRSILKCIASALLKCQWIRMRMLVEIKDWSTKIIKNALLYTFFSGPFWMHTINDSNQFYLRAVMWYKDKNSFQLNKHIKIHKCIHTFHYYLIKLNNWILHILFTLFKLSYYLKCCLVI